MPALFEFRIEKDFHFASRFAEQFEVKCINNRVKLPEDLGQGYIQEVSLPNGLSLCMHAYTLNQEFILRRTNDVSPSLITIKFDCRRPQLHSANAGEPSQFDVEFGSSDHFSELRLKPGKFITFLVIGSPREALLKLLQIDENNISLQKILLDKKSFLVHETLTPDMERVLKQISLITDNTELSILLYQTRAQELIYLLLSKIMGRNQNSFALGTNRADAEGIYRVREALLADVAKTPKLAELAVLAGMSATKMKGLFRQIFGQSIYNYYQAAKMNEGSFLLKNYSVSETGYRLGFTNLSHFTRIFEKHFGVKPKRYKDSMLALEN